MDAHRNPVPSRLPGEGQELSGVGLWLHLAAYPSCRIGHARTPPPTSNVNDPHRSHASLSQSKKRCLLSSRRYPKGIGVTARDWRG